ncbi:MAG: hypothetical protein K6E49_00060 [Lachnospiraceae bacterium]|nr:hypothetical protein [Lachnospiraceae bacterium]
MSDYSHIMDHPHYQSKTRPHMSMVNRAAQFSPFAALTGYDEAVEDTKSEVLDEMMHEVEHEDIDINSI